MFSEQSVVVSSVMVACALQVRQQLPQRQQPLGATALPQLRLQQVGPSLQLKFHMSALQAGNEAEQRLACMP